MPLDNMNKLIRFIKKNSVYILLAIFALLTTCGSSVLIQSKQYENPDCSAFRYMGMLIAKGGTPYVDAFDNKGPLMYFFQYIGYCLNKEYGVYFVELLSIYSFYVVSYKICRRFLGCFLSVIAVVISCTPLSVFYFSNLTEEYCLFFTALGILIFIDYFIFYKDGFIRIIICGICFGAVLLIRANMAAAWPVFCIYVIIKYIIDKHKLPFHYIFSFLCGIIIVTLPFFIWLFSKGAIEEFWKDYIITNFAFTNKVASLKGVLSCCIHLFLASFMEIFVVALVYSIIKKKNCSFNIIYIIYMLFNLYMSCVSGVVYDHYGMILIPSLIYPSAILVRNLSDGLFKNRKILGCVSTLAISSIFIFFIFNNCLSFIGSTFSNDQYDQERQEVLALINEYTDEEDRILVLGYSPQYYLDSERLCSSRFYYTFYSENYPDGEDAVISDLNQELPQMVICLNAYDDLRLFNNFDKYDKIHTRGVWLLKDNK